MGYPMLVRGCVFIENIPWISWFVPWHLTPLQWRHNERDGVSNHHPDDCLLNRLFRRRSKETSKLRVTGLCAGNSPVTGEFPAQMASNAENVSIWWRHHDVYITTYTCITEMLNPWRMYSIFHKICTPVCCALFSCGYVISSGGFTWYIYPYLSGLHHWHWHKRVPSE